MITYNEEHYIYNAIRQHLKYVSEVIILDSYSSDKTVELAVEAGASVFQRNFKGFGDQWDYAVKNLPVKSEWVMKMDPDESVEKRFWEILGKNLNQNCNGFTVVRRLWFMKKPLKVRHRLLRVWRQGNCRFENVSVNEHPMVADPIHHLPIEIQHHDSPNLHHWILKQNMYSTLEARARIRSEKFSFQPKFFGSSLERRMFLKAIYKYIPFRHEFYFLHCLILLGGVWSGRPGIIWAKLRKSLFQLRELKLKEMKNYGDNYPKNEKIVGAPSPLATQCEG